MNARVPYIGQAIPRVEDLRLLRGRGQFIDDVHCDGVLHGAVFRSPVAHGRIVNIDVSAARAMPGVVSVITAADLTPVVPKLPVRIEPHPLLRRFEQPVLAGDIVRYVGEPIVFVVAVSAAIAEDAAVSIEVDIDTLPVVMDREASDANEVLIFPEHGENHAITIEARRGDADAAFEAADYRRRERLRVHRHAAMPLETRGVLAEWNQAAAAMKVSGAMKAPFAARTILASLLQLDEAHIDLMEVDAGGGFGARGEVYSEDFLVAHAARLLGRPVKWIEDRREHLLTTSPAREVDCEIEIACRRDGTILALRGRAWCDMGAYIRPNAATAPRNVAQMIGGPYRVPAVSMDVAMVLTTKTPSASYRGPGRFECDFFRERMFDLAAADLGIDKVEFRRRNLLTEKEMPWEFPKTTPIGGGGQTDSGDYHITFDRCLEEIGWKDKTALQGQRIDGRYHGLAIGCFIEGGATGPKENARIRLDPDGSIAVSVGASAVGQGVETIFAQIAADALSVPIERIRGVAHGSTTLVKEGWGSNASRGTVMGGSAILAAAANLLAAIRASAAQQFGCEPDVVEIAPGLVSVNAGGKSRSVAELSGEGFSADGTFVNNRRTYTYGAHAAHVAVDAATGQVEVLDYVTVEDVGRIINPGTLHGQVMGAVVQGLGASLLEEIVYDDSGQPLTGTLANYLMPGAEDFPNIRGISLEMYPSPTNPLGAKGAGEGGIIPVGGVIANAVASALAPLGVHPWELPLSPQRIWRLIRDAQHSLSAKTD